MALIYKIASTLGLYGSPQTFRIRVHIICTNEWITIDGISESTLVRQLKGRIEELVGIPGPLQELYYLDRFCLIDDYPLSHFEILPNAKVILRMSKASDDIVGVCQRGNLEIERRIRPHEFSFNKEYHSSWESQDQRNKKVEKVNIQVNPNETFHQTMRYTKSQTYDSALPTWLGGTSSRKYTCITLDDKYPATAVTKAKLLFKP